MNQARPSNPVKPVAFAALREQLRAQFASYEYWLLVCDSEATRAIKQIERRHYHNAGESDFAVSIVEWYGRTFSVIAARKRRMTRRELAKLLRRFSRVDFAARDSDGCDLLICAADLNMTPATMLAAALLDEQAAQLCAAHPHRTRGHETTIQHELDEHHPSPISD